jgi:hypothetical protein
VRKVKVSMLTFHGLDSAFEMERLIQSGRAMNTAASTGFEIRFQSLFNEGRALSFPCDSRGLVNMDSLSDRARENYLYARAVVGREFSVPAVLPRALH